MKQLVGGLYQKSPASVAGSLPILVEFHDHARTASSGQTRTHDTAAKDVSAARRTTCAVRARQMQQLRRRSGRTGTVTGRRGAPAIVVAHRTHTDRRHHRTTRPGLHCAAHSVLAPVKVTTGKEMEIPWFPSRNNRSPARPPAIAQPWPVIAGALFRERHRSHSHRTTQSHTPRTEAPRAHALKRQALGSHS